MKDIEGEFAHGGLCKEKARLATAERDRFFQRGGVLAVERIAGRHFQNSGCSFFGVSGHSIKTLAERDGGQPPVDVSHQQVLHLHRCGL